MYVLCAKYYSLRELREPDPFRHSDAPIHAQVRHLVEGKTLQERLYDMNEQEKRAISDQLGPLMKAWGGWSKTHMTLTSVSSVGCKQTYSLGKATAE